MLNVIVKLTRFWGSQLIILLVLLAFIISSPVTHNAVYAQTYANLPSPGTLMAAGHAYYPEVLRGIKVDAQDIFKLSFILDQGDTKLDDAALRKEIALLLRYFLTALTMPESDIWVNLSPYEANRIILPQLGTTELGHDLLAQDYILKQLSSSLTYPETAVGKKYWNVINNTVLNNHFPTTQSFNKIWISPGETQILEHENTAFIKEAKLKVMMEKDYLAMQNDGMAAIPRNRPDDGRKHGFALTDSDNAFKTQILPLIAKEVNSGEHFAKLRQIHNAVVLATWFKQHLKDTIYNKLYIDKKKNGGINTNDAFNIEKIYAQYVEAFKKGAYSYIKQEHVVVDEHSPTQKIVKHQYYSGGATEDGIGKVVHDGEGTVDKDTLHTAILIECRRPIVVATTAHPLDTFPLSSADAHNFKGEITTAVANITRLRLANPNPVSEHDGRTYGEEDALYGYFTHLTYPVAKNVLAKIRRELSRDIAPYLYKELDRIRKTERRKFLRYQINPMGSLMLVEDLRAKKIVIGTGRDEKIRVEPPVTTYSLNPLTKTLEPRDFTTNKYSTINEARTAVQALGKKMVDEERARAILLTVSSRNHITEPLGSAKISFDEAVIMDNRLERLGVDDTVLLDALDRAVMDAGGKNKLGNTKHPIVIELISESRHIAEDHSANRYIGLNGRAIERINAEATINALRTISNQIAAKLSVKQTWSEDDTRIVRLVDALRDPNETVSLSVVKKCRKILATAALAHEVIHEALGDNIANLAQFELEQRARDWEFIQDLCAKYDLPVALFIEVLKASKSFIPDAGIFAYYDVAERINLASDRVDELRAIVSKDQLEALAQAHKIKINWDDFCEKFIATRLGERVGKDQLYLTNRFFLVLGRGRKVETEQANLLETTRGVFGNDIFYNILPVLQETREISREHISIRKQAYDLLSVLGYRLFLDLQEHPQFKVNPVQFNALWGIIQSLAPIGGTIMQSDIGSVLYQKLIETRYMREIATGKAELAMDLGQVKKRISADEFGQILSIARRYQNDLRDSDPVLQARGHFVRASAQAIANNHDLFSIAMAHLNELVEVAHDELWLCEAWSNILDTAIKTIDDEHLKEIALDENEQEQLIHAVETLVNGNDGDRYRVSLVQELSDLLTRVAVHNRGFFYKLVAAAKKNLKEPSVDCFFASIEQALVKIGDNNLADTTIDQIEGFRQDKASGSHVARNIKKRYYDYQSRKALGTDNVKPKSLEEVTDGGFSEGGLKLKIASDNAFKLSAKNISLDPNDIKGFELTITSIDRSAEKSLKF